MVIVAPGYLNKKVLPYASDIFYHDRLIYFLPTGFHPQELNNVAHFPEYCSEHSEAMPQLIWEMCGLYFENSRHAFECLDILQPLYKKHITIAMTSYSRDRTAIDLAQALLHEHPQLLSALMYTDIDLMLISRELLSHVLFEILIEEGYQGAIKYLRANTGSPEKFLYLVAATLLNRLRIFGGQETKLLVYEQSWYPFIRSALPLLTGEGFSDDNDVGQIEHFRYKLFETILMPIYGKCDSKRKSKLVAKISIKHSQAIVSLKDKCETIAQDVLLQTKSQELQQKILTEGIKIKISEPLAELIEKPLRDVLKLLRDFTLDSTVIGGLIATTQGATGSTLALAIAAGAISTGVKYLLSEEQRHLQQPSMLLLDGMKKACMDEESIQMHLQSISMKNLCIPEDWKHIT